MSEHPTFFVTAGRDAYEWNGRGILLFLEADVLAASESEGAYKPDLHRYLTENQTDFDTFSVPSRVRGWVQGYDPATEALVAVWYLSGRVRAFRCNGAFQQQ